jgi:hypothetical protein
VQTSCRSFSIIWMRKCMTLTHSVKLERVT